MTHQLNKLIVLLFLLSNGMSGQQKYPQNYFQAPLDIPLYLSGTFGELRSNHFHAGIDIKTQGVEGKRVLAAADGYVSRINVSTSGYGKAIYINHPNGLMTVYAHLQRFNEDIEAYVREQQHGREVYELTLYPDQGKLSVKQGQTIALSGNTGGSGGPHLHFEIRDQGGERPVNPLHYGFDISDTQSPKLFRVKLYEIDINGKIRAEKEIPLSPGPNNTYTAASGSEIKLHSTFAVGVQGYDHQNGSNNKNGIYRVAVLHQDNPYFSFQADAIRFDQSRYINAFIDYRAKYKESKTFYRLYQMPNYNLDAHPEDQNRGIIHVGENGSYTIQMEAVDFHGNTSKVNIPVTILCREFEIDSVRGSIWNWDMANAVSERGIRAAVSENTLYEDAEINYQILDPCQGCIAPQIKIGDPSIPLHRSLTIAFLKDIIDDGYSKNQMVVARHVGNGKWQSIGADDNTPIQLMSYSKTFGTFSVMVDSVPPQLLPKNFYNGQTITSGRRLQLHLSDDFSGIDTFRATLNGKWILMEYEPKLNMLFYTFDDNFIAGENVLNVTAWDNCKNKIQKEWTIIRK